METEPPHSPVPAFAGIWAAIKTLVNVNATICGFAKI